MAIYQIDLVLVQSGTFQCEFYGMGSSYAIRVGRDQIISVAGKTETA